MITLEHTLVILLLLVGLLNAKPKIPKLAWWAIAFGAGFGGNGTIIGSTANIIVATLSEKTRTPITSSLWNQRGLPVMLVTCAIASVLYAILYRWF